MKLELTGKSGDKISTAGKVENGDFGYYGESARGEVEEIKLSPYDTTAQPLKAVTVFDYSGCKGHSVALFATNQGWNDYDWAALKGLGFNFKHDKIRSALVPVGLQLWIEGNDGKKTIAYGDHECQEIKSGGDWDGKWTVSVNQT